MNKNQEIIVTLLSSAIRNRPLEKIDAKGICWRDVYIETKAHEVHTLIYPVIKKLESSLGPEDELIAEWQRNTLVSGMLQLQHVQQIGQVLEAFNESGIETICLKGLVLREMYPQPELRTMSDADILVQTKDVDKAEKLLVKMGYTIDSSDPKHIHFIHDNYPAIELHRFLVIDKYKIKGDTLNNNIWKNKTCKKVFGTDSYSLSPEDMALHLCIHMASHITCEGFGLRQLCDFVLFIESKVDEIDWVSFYQKVKLCGIEDFVNAVFITCKKLLNLRIPAAVNINTSMYDPIIELLIDDIFNGGVYGKRTVERQIGNLQMQFSSIDVQNSSLHKLFDFLTLLFPSPKKLGDRYSYAKKYPMLAPLAWVHRFIYNVIRKDINSQEKKGYLFPSQETKEVRKSRTRLLNWLDLR